MTEQTKTATQAADAERALLDAGYHYARGLVSPGTIMTKPLIVRRPPDLSARWLIL